MSRILSPVSIARASSAAIWSPANIAGCVLGLFGNKTSVAVDAALATWPDQMGLGGAAQATGSKQPLHKIVDGEHVVLFDETDDRMSVADRDSLDFGTGSFTVWARVHSDGSIRNSCSLLNKFVADTDGRRGYILGYDSSGNDILGYLGDDSITLYTTSNAYEAEGWYSIIMTRDGAAGNLYINGANVHTVGSLSTRNCTSDGALCIMAQTTTWYGADLGVAGIGIFNRALNESERALLDAWKST